jgi:peroxiredoxin
MLEGVIHKYGIKDYDQFRPTPPPKLRCTITLSKIESANLFNLLYRQGIFTFDLKSDAKREKAELDFINENFNYINQHGKVAKMTNIIKEFGVINKFAYKESQKKALDSLIDKLTLMRQNLD